VPATFPSHQAAVLPLKLWRPRWFDGVALVAGSAAPDAAYPLAGFVSLPENHTWWGLLWFSRPVADVATLVGRGAAPGVAAHLPTGGPLRLRDYGVLGRVRHPWYVTITSILIGAVSHLVWDAFTHPPAGSNSWGVRAFTGLRMTGPWELPWWFVVQHASSVIGAAGTVAVLWHIGRTGALRRWHGAPPPVTRSMGRFWAAATVVMIVGLAVLRLLPFAHSAHVTGVRVLYTVACALVAGAVAVRMRAARIGDPSASRYRPVRRP
jgi:hypothetical protein